MPHDGEADHEDNLLVVSQGWASCRVSEGHEELDELLKLVRIAAKKKAAKNYGNDVVLVIAIRFFPWPNYETAVAIKIKDCANTLLDLNFSGRAIYIFNTATKIIYPV